MSEVFRNVLNASFQGGVLIMAVIVLRLVLKRAPKKYICLLWILVGIRLAVPLNLESSLSLQPRGEPVTREMWQQMEDFGQILPGNSAAEGLGTEVQEVLPANPEMQEVPVSMPEPVGVTVSRGISWASLFPYLWIAGTGGMFIYSFVSCFMLKRRVRGAIRTAKDIWETEKIGTAFILGYFRPRIYLPVAASGESREMILRHERCHLKRGDHRTKLLGFLILAAHWFNPLVWLAFRLLSRDLEAACDEQVVGEMDLTGRKQYAQALLACSSNPGWFGACPVAFGEKPVRRRILAVLGYRKPRFWITAAALGAVLLAAVCFLTSPREEAPETEIPQLQYTQSATARRVAEPLNPSIVFSGLTWDTETDQACYQFDPEVPEEDRDKCVFYADAILSRLGLAEKPALMVLDSYEGAWTDGETLYLGARDFSSKDFFAELIVEAYGGYANYGGAYGYGAWLSQQEGWEEVLRFPRVSVTASDARDMNLLCFRDDFVTRQEVETNKEIARQFAADCIDEMGEAEYLQLLQCSGDVAGAGQFRDALERWYGSYDIDYTPTDILYGIGGEYHDYLVRCFYGTFYLPKAWENRHFSSLAKDGNFLHESYCDVKLYFETAASQMAYIQNMFGVHEDTSDITVEFLLSGTGGTWAARNQIMLHYHAYIPRSYINMMLYRHTMLRDGRMNYNWLYHGIGEYLAQMGPSEYEDAVLLYSVNHENRAYSTMEGDWYSIWQEVTKGETDPDILWRTRWDLIAYYYDRELHNGGYGQISFTAYLAEQIGIETLWDYLLQTENPCPDIDFARYRTQWEAYLDETYGEYPTYAEYVQ